MEFTEKIPREKDRETCLRMIDMNVFRNDSLDDFWHAVRFAHVRVTWAGINIYKTEQDLRRYFEILAKKDIEVVVETGGQYGGSLLFFMDCLQFLGKTNVPVISIDIPGSWNEQTLDYPHPHMLIRNDCLDSKTIERILPLIEGKRSLISLDSVHTKEHVEEELKMYAPLSTIGSYLVIEDTDHNGHPIMGNYGPCAWEATQEFLSGPLGKRFEVDTELESLCGVFTGNPSGWLRCLR